ncbi:hypothetical protein Nmel_000996 [Mimus melanotis]
MSVKCLVEKAYCEARYLWHIVSPQSGLR